ncbi:hypothetical protein AZKH_4261 [Azoarcus sp. KH32C]|nr:hypothetical protein AZKH_4261 [Azoarcus sp. KH32C]
MLLSGPPTAHPAGAAGGQKQDCRVVPRAGCATGKQGDACLSPKGEFASPPRRTAGPREAEGHDLQSCFCPPAALDGPEQNKRQTRSNTPAAPIPVPMHIEIIP